MEWLDIVDENGIPTGETVERKRAHREGICHRTAHVWLLREKEGEIQVLLQKRSADKDSHPGCYDISSAGHIPAGVDWLPSAVREMKEELGIDITIHDLHLCGQRRIHWKEKFYGEDFVDNQVSNIYYVWKNVDESQLALQESEVEEVRWMSLKECKDGVENHSFPNCIFLEELNMLPQNTGEKINENTNV